jgi:serine protease Do
MPRVRPPLATPLRMFGLAVLALALGAAAASVAASADRRGDAPPPVFDKPLPEGVPDLKAIQAHVKKITDKVIPCTVGLQIGPAQGSGVIVNADGYILTAAHVSGQPGRPVTVILHDGRRLQGITLGAEVGIDSGLVKITDAGAEFPHIDMGRSADLKKGQWVVAIGHPGGWQPGRPPVVRVGRVLEANAKLLRTDCTLVGGDSGGPLFDMHGRVVGVHSRIGGSITFNIHVPVDTYTDTWDKLAASEVWGSPFNGGNFGKLGQEPFLGVRPDPDSKQFRILAVSPNSPAAKAGLRADDVIIGVDSHAIGSVADFDAVLRGKQPGNQVTLQIHRGGEELSITVTLGKRPME